MYIKTHKIPGIGKDEWVTTLFLDDGTKVKASISVGYRAAMELATKWSEENNNCPNDKGYDSLMQNGT
tara:strand:+ start:571 stop:774 length:204 start_codon:yes stop_codon:yes gene_type:complete